MKQAVKSVSSRYIPIVVYLVLAFLLFKNAADAATNFAQISLRYSEVPLPVSQVVLAKNYLQNPKNTPEFIPSFWHQEKGVEFVSDFATVEAMALFVDGEMSGAMPVQFIRGTYPGADDKTGIAVSEEVAWQLWGGSDVVGTALEWREKSYTVRGVFAGSDLMVLVQVDAARMDPEAVFEGVELMGETTLDAQQAGKDFAQKLGIGAPTTVVDGPGLAALIMVAAWLPAGILILWFLIRLLKVVHRLSFWYKQVFWLGVLLALAFGIPALLDLLPGFLVPTKWSDLAFWSDVGKQISARVTEWLMLVPSIKDMQLKRQMIWQAFLLYPSLFAVVIMIRKWDARLSRAFAGAPREAAAMVGEDGLPAIDGLGLLGSDGLPVADGDAQKAEAGDTLPLVVGDLPEAEVLAQAPAPSLKKEDEDDAPPRPKRRKAAAKAKAKANSLEPELEAKVEAEAEAKVELEVKLEPEAKVELEAKLEPEVKVELEAKPEPEAKVEPEAKPEPESVAELDAPKEEFGYDGDFISR